jgi:tRNA(Arg) A34 adenosine deaminase TadA
MCAAAAYWCNQSRVVFGISEISLRALRADHVRAAGIPISARTILESAPRAISVIGPALEQEAIEAHRLFWPSAKKGI